MIDGHDAIKESTVFELIGRHVWLLSGNFGETYIEWVGRESGEKVTKKEECQPCRHIIFDLVIVELKKEIAQLLMSL